MDKYYEVKAKPYKSYDVKGEKLIFLNVTLNCIHTESEDGKIEKQR